MWFGSPILFATAILADLDWLAREVSGRLLKPICIVACLLVPCAKDEPKLPRQLGFGFGRLTARIVHLCLRRQETEDLAYYLKVTKTRPCKVAHCRGVHASRRAVVRDIQGSQPCSTLAFMASRRAGGLGGRCGPFTPSNALLSTKVSSLASLKGGTQSQCVAVQTSRVPTELAVAVAVDSGRGFRGQVWAWCPAAWLGLGPAVARQELYASAS
mmetsp:Transcript_14084/g.35664  ORF Transcript_14084/g.35664 Transcript_14084/m.35664 type:complete len:214 (+) Transcript_14084:542-1183(+)